MGFPIYFLSIKHTDRGILIPKPIYQLLLSPFKLSLDPLVVVASNGIIVPYRIREDKSIYYLSVVEKFFSIYH